jgi:hypothetical protein
MKKNKFFFNRKEGTTLKPETNRNYTVMKGAIPSSTPRSSRYNITLIHNFTLKIIETLA